jgi:YfiH family protein
VTAAPAGPLRFGGFAQLEPDWDAPARVKAFVTGRPGGVSTGPWGAADGGGGLNLGAGCGDDPRAVAENRARLAACLPSAPRWLRQVHGTRVHVAAGHGNDASGEPEADAAVTAHPGAVLAVLTADCLPVLLCDARARAVAIAHAGWRGMAGGVIERSVEALRALAGGDAQVLAWLGPAIGPRAFEVGEDVVRAFCDADPASAAAFVPASRDGKWFADLYRLARLRLARLGVGDVRGGDHCTVSEPDRFYSHRRDRTCGRMAALIWLDPS